MSPQHTQAVSAGQTLPHRLHVSPRLQLPLPVLAGGSGQRGHRVWLLCWQKGSTLILLPHSQSYGPEHLLTFHNLKRIGLLTEQSAGETLTAVESKVSKLVTDRAAGEPAHCPMALGAWEGELLPPMWLPAWGKRVGCKHQACVQQCCCRQGSGLCCEGTRAGSHQTSSRAHSSVHLYQPGSGIQTEPLKVFLLVMFSRKDHRCI